MRIPETNLKPWEVLAHEDVSPSKWYRLWKDTVRLEDGIIIDDYYVSDLGDVATIIPITSNNEVVMVRQYKHGSGKIVTGAVAGRVDEDAPENGADRELRQETGVRASKFEPAGSFTLEAAKGLARSHVFVARDVIFNNEVLQEQDLDSTEKIEVVLVPLSEISSMMKHGLLDTSNTISALTLARAHGLIEW